MKLIAQILRFTQDDTGGGLSELKPTRQENQRKNLNA